MEPLELQKQVDELIKQAAKVMVDRERALEYLEQGRLLLDTHGGILPARDKALLQGELALQLSKASQPSDFRYGDIEPMLKAHEYGAAGYESLGDSVDDGILDKLGLLYSNAGIYCTVPTATVKERLDQYKHRGLDYYQSARRVFERLPWGTDSWSAMRVGGVYLRIGQLHHTAFENPNEALKYYLKAISVLNKPIHAKDEFCQEKLLGALEGKLSAKKQLALEEKEDSQLLAPDELTLLKELLSKKKDFQRLPLPTLESLRDNLTTLRENQNPSIRNLRSRAQICNRIASKEHAKQVYENRLEAIRYYRESIDVYQKLIATNKTVEDIEALARTLHSLAYVYSAQGDGPTLVQAIEYLQKAIEYYHHAHPNATIESRKTLARYCSGLADFHRRIGKEIHLQESIRALEGAINLLEPIRSEDSSVSKLIAENHNQLGYTYRKLRHFNAIGKAVDHHQKAAQSFEEHWRRSKDIDALFKCAQSLKYMGDVLRDYQSNARTENALVCYRQAVELLEGNPSPENPGWNNNLGDAYRSWGDCLLGGNASCQRRSIELYQKSVAYLEIAICQNSANNSRLADPCRQQAAMTESSASIAYSNLAGQLGTAESIEHICNAIAYLEAVKQPLGEHFQITLSQYLFNRGRHYKNIGDARGIVDFARAASILHRMRRRESRAAVAYLQAQERIAIAMAYDPDPLSAEARELLPFGEIMPLVNDALETIRHWNRQEKNDLRHFVSIFVQLGGDQLLIDAPGKLPSFLMGEISTTENPDNDAFATSAYLTAYALLDQLNSVAKKEQLTEVDILSQAAQVRQHLQRQEQVFLGGTWESTENRVNLLIHQGEISEAGQFLESFIAENKAHTGSVLLKYKMYIRFNGDPSKCQALIEELAKRLKQSSPRWPNEMEKEAIRRKALDIAHSMASYLISSIPPPQNTAAVPGEANRVYRVAVNHLKILADVFRSFKWTTVVDTLSTFIAKIENEQDNWQNYHKHHCNVAAQRYVELAFRSIEAVAPELSAKVKQTLALFEVQLSRIHELSEIEVEQLYDQITNILLRKCGKDFQSVSTGDLVAEWQQFKEKSDLDYSALPNEICRWLSLALSLQRQPAYRHLVGLQLGLALESVLAQSVFPAIKKLDAVEFEQLQQNTSEDHAAEQFMLRFLSGKQRIMLGQMVFLLQSGVFWSKEKERSRMIQQLLDPAFAAATEQAPMMVSSPEARKSHRSQLFQLRDLRNASAHPGSKCAEDSIDVGFQNLLADNGFFTLFFGCHKKSENPKRER